MGLAPNSQALRTTGFTNVFTFGPKANLRPKQGAVERLQSVLEKGQRVSPAQGGGHSPGTRLGRM